MGTPVVDPPTAPAPDPDPATDAVHGRPAYTRVAVAGLVLMAAAPAVMLTLGLLAGMDISGEIAFFGTLIVVPLVVAALVWRFGAWAKILGILTALGMAAMMFWAAFGLAYPGSVGDFVPGVLLPLGAILTIGGAVAAILQGRRGNRPTSTTPPERRIISTSVGLVALALVVSVVAGFVQRESLTDAQADLTATIADFEFVEGIYEVAAGEPTTILVRNSDAFVHTFTVPELDIHETLVAGSDALVEIEAGAGAYTLYCEPHADMNEPDPEEAGMAGRIVVR